MIVFLAGRSESRTSPEEERMAFKRQNAMQSQIDRPPRLTLATAQAVHA